MNEIKFVPFIWNGEEWEELTGERLRQWLLEPVQPLPEPLEIKDLLPGRWAGALWNKRMKRWDRISAVIVESNSSTDAREALQEIIVETSLFYDEWVAAGRPIGLLSKRNLFVLIHKEDEPVVDEIGPE